MEVRGQEEDEYSLCGDEGPEHKHFLSDTISRAEFVSNIGKLRTKLEISCSLQFWWYL